MFISNQKGRQGPHIPRLSEIVNLRRSGLGIDHQVVLLILFGAGAFSTIALSLPISRPRRAFDFENFWWTEIPLRRFDGRHGANSGNGGNFHLVLPILEAMYRQNEAKL